MLFGTLLYVVMFVFGTYVNAMMSVNCLFVQEAFVLIISSHIRFMRDKRSDGLSD